MAAERPRKTVRKKRSKWVRRIKITLALLFIVVLGAVAAGFMVYMPIYRQAVDDAYNIDKRLVVHSSVPSLILSSDGHVLYRQESIHREVKDVMQLPKHVRDAMVAAEDRRFYDHKGVDFVGLLRSAYKAVSEGHASQGGSTIDMQLAKRLVNGDEHSFKRKLKDIATAQQIENLKTKDEILNLYMNQVYFGEGAYGIEAAAETYFGKHAAKLTIAEAAMLARCVRHPSKQNPIKDLDGSLQRRDYVLGVMRDEAWITPEQYEEAIQEKPKINRGGQASNRYLNNTAGYFVDSIIKQFKDDFPGQDLKSGGYRIVTTLNYKLQLEANAAVRETLRDFRSWDVTNAAFVLTNSSGQILCEVGGPDYQRIKFNIITTDHRQPGSSFKPFVYAAALKEGTIHMGDQISNAPIEKVLGPRKVWVPRNSSPGEDASSYDLADALARSVNLCAIHTIEKVGPLTVVNYAKDAFGFTSPLHAFDSLAIGTSEVNPLEMDEAYSVFMLRGDRVKPYAIQEVTDPDGNTKEYVPERYTNVFDSVICDDIDQLLKAVVDYGTGTAANVVPNARGKTGTTQDAKDAWFCGYSDGLVGIGWVGNTVWRHGRPHSMRMSSAVFGGTVTAKMWAKIMGSAHDLHLAKPPAPTTVAARAKGEEDKPDKDSDEDNPEKRKDETDGSFPQPKEKVEKLNPDDDAVPPDPADDVSSKTPKQPKQQSSGDPNDVPPDPSGRDDQTASSPPVEPKVKTVSAPTQTEKPSEKQDSDYVTVQVCADTGMRATIYCPETVTRRYKRGTEPRVYCRLHTGR